MQRVITELVDDLDGESEATETVTFGIDGAEYEIDLSATNADSLRQSLADYVAVARRTGGRRARRAPSRTAVATEVDTKAVRAWAKSQDIALSSRGRVPASVIEQYRQAGN